MLYNGMLILAIVAALAVGVAVGYVFKQRLSRKKLESCENLSARIIDEAKKEAETIKKEAVLQAKENLLKVKTEFERDSRDRKGELDALERRLRSKEENHRSEDRSPFSERGCHRKPGKSDPAKRVSAQ